MAIAGSSEMRLSPARLIPFRPGQERPPVKVGEIWAYREKAYTKGWPVVPVELLQFGPGRATKVRVRYVQGEYQGLDVWVPTVRLRVLWDQVDAWLQDERCFAAAREASLDALDTVEHWAVWSVLYAYPRPDGILLGLDRSEGATAQIEDLDAVAADLGLDPHAVDRDVGKCG